jgi:hypothetical protein
MYHKKFIAVIKNQGKTLRDGGGLVRLPFGSTYSILLKNKNSVKAVANVEVDGEDVLQNHGIIVSPNQSVEVTGWMRNMDRTNKFKFIRKTKEIQKFRGDRLDDGLVRIAYKFEKQLAFEPVVIKDPWPVCPKNDWPKCPTNRWGTGYINDSFTTPIAGSLNGNYVMSSYNCSAPLGDGKITVKNNRNIPLKDEGITIKGKIIDQGYRYATTNLLENTSHVIIINLRGISKTGRKVEKVITTRSRTQCDVCGRKWKSNVKYCGNCGNCLR